MVYYAAALAEYPGWRGSGNPYAQNYHGEWRCGLHHVEGGRMVHEGRSGLACQCIYQIPPLLAKRPTEWCNTTWKAQMWFCCWPGPADVWKDSAARTDVLASTTTVQRNQAWNMAVEGSASMAVRLSIRLLLRMGSSPESCQPQRYSSKRDRQTQQGLPVECVTV